MQEQRVKAPGEGATEMGKLQRAVTVTKNTDTEGWTTEHLASAGWGRGQGEHSPEGPATLRSQAAWARRSSKAVWLRQQAPGAGSPEPD